MREEYIGDGVYALFDGYSVWCDCRAQSELSCGPTGIPGICLEPETMNRLVAFYKRCVSPPTERG